MLKFQCVPANYRLIQRNGEGGREARHLAHGAIGDLSLCFSRNFCTTDEAVIIKRKKKKKKELNKQKKK